MEKRNIEGETPAYVKEAESVNRKEKLRKEEATIKGEKEKNNRNRDLHLPR
jgi:hypothetical protein